MEKKKKNDVDNTNTDKPKTRLHQLEEEHQQDNNGLINKTISEIQSLFSQKNNNTSKQKQSKQNKRFTAEIQLDQNILNVSLFKNKKQNDEPINKLLRKISKEKLTERLTISLDGKKLEKSQYEIKSNKIISLVLDNNNDPNISYDVIATSDENDKELN